MPAPRKASKPAARRTASTRTSEAAPPAVNSVGTGPPPAVPLRATVATPMPTVPMPPGASAPAAGAAEGGKGSPESTGNGASPHNGSATSTDRTAKDSGKAGAAKSPASADAEKPKKPKLVRDSFTMPKTEYAVLQELKLRAATLGQPAKKSELLRAGLKALVALSDEALLANLAALPRVKASRPAKA